MSGTGRTGNVRAGRVVSPHGLDGAVKVADPVPLLLKPGIDVDVAGQLLRIEQRSGTDARPILRFAGVASRDAADSLRGAEIRVAREVVPELGEDEFWSVDLIGCAVVDGAVAVGRVEGVLGLPSCEALEVRREGFDAVLLVPLIDDAVRSVDLDTRLVDINLDFLGVQR